MNWQPKVKDLYERVVENIPEVVRPVIKPALFEATELKSKERNGSEVAEVDLVVALFEVTPPAFQPTMIADLNKLGIDYDRYMAKVKGDFKCNNDLDQLVEDMMRLGDISEVSCDKDAIWEVLHTYEQFFKGSSVSIRTTTKPVENRDLSVRYVELMHAHDAYTTAIESGLIKDDGHKSHEMIQEVINTFEIMGYGVDLDGRVGVSKIWPFVVPGSIDPIFSMQSIPESMKASEEYFNAHGLNIFSLFAFDFSHHTTNIYFMLSNPSKNSVSTCKGLVQDAGFTLVSDEIMEKCADAAHLNYTFSWESNCIERLCFGVTCHDATEVPVHWHPLIKNFVENSPFQSDIKKFIYGVTFTPKGIYYKIENDYNGTMVDFLLMGARAGIEAYK
ncbi:MAG: hypothetical protein BAJALOKI1v1_1200006 [Promethearchaeota archaeon]|nr:MAG: hypothetical protein BAJALOKI1v1_1200006 [Candidatus Lokiarchaeota archaeon]